MDDLDVRPGETIGQRGCQHLIDLQGREARCPSAEEMRRQPGPGPDLEDVVAEHQRAQYPGEEVGLQVALPSGAGEKIQVKFVHRGSFSGGSAPAAARWL